jgi:hypothetical protein
MEHRQDDERFVHQSPCNFHDSNLSNISLRPRRQQNCSQLTSAPERTPPRRRKIVGFAVTRERATKQTQTRSRFRSTQRLMNQRATHSHQQFRHHQPIGKSAVMRWLSMRLEGTSAVWTWPRTKPHSLAKRRQIWNCRLQQWSVRQR